MGKRGIGPPTFWLLPPPLVKSSELNEDSLNHFLELRCHDNDITVNCYTRRTRVGPIYADAVVYFAPSFML